MKRETKTRPNKRELGQLNSLMVQSQAPYPFWLEGPLDWASVEACKYHPRHNWTVIDLREALQNPLNELIVMCKGCYVLRCKASHKGSRCIFARDHGGHHMTESRQVIPQEGR